MTMTSQFADMVSSSFFDADLFHLSNLVTGPSFMSRSLMVLELWQKGLTRNSEIGSTPARVLPSIWRLEQDGDAKFTTNIFNEMLLNAEKCQGYCFYHFWLIKGKPAGGKTTFTQTRVNK